MLVKFCPRFLPKEVTLYSTTLPIFCNFSPPITTHHTLWKFFTSLNSSFIARFPNKLINSGKTHTVICRCKDSFTVFFKLVRKWTFILLILSKEIDLLPSRHHEMTILTFLYILNTDFLVWIMHRFPLSTNYVRLIV